MYTDQILVTKAQNGCMKSFESLIKRYEKYIFNIALRMNAGCFFDEAQDITQEVFIKVFKSLPQFKHNSSFKVWLYRIAFNTSIDYLKKNRKYPPWQTLECSHEEYLNTHHPAVRYYNESERNLLLQEIKMKCLISFLICMTPKERAIYILISLLQIKGKIASEIFQISYTNLRKIHSRAQQKLCKALNDECSLINKDAPCKCEKTIAENFYNDFIRENVREYARNNTTLFRKLLTATYMKFHDYLVTRCNTVMQSVPEYEPEKTITNVKKLLDDKSMKDVINFSS